MVIKPNGKLWQAIREENLTQEEFSRIVGDNPAVVSLIVTGKLIPTEEQKIRYAATLRRKVTQVF